MSLKWLVDVVLVPMVLSVGTGIYTGFLVGRIVTFDNEMQRARERTLTLPERLNLMLAQPNEGLAVLHVSTLYLDIAHSMLVGHRQLAAGDRLTRLTFTIERELRAIHRGVFTNQPRARADAEFRDSIIEEYTGKIRKVMKDALTDIEAIRPDWSVLMLGSWAPVENTADNPKVI
jgi:hypothetical protein